MRPETVLLRERPLMGKEPDEPPSEPNGLVPHLPRALLTRFPALAARRRADRFALMTASRLCAFWAERHARGVSYALSMAQSKSGHVPRAMSA